MSVRKLFCILEQGKFVNDPLTLEHMRQFDTKFSSFYRLNWHSDQDNNAFVHEKNIVWSEGRSILWEKVPKDYDYYIFIDDDVKFLGWNVASRIARELEKYQPLSGTFYDSRAWHFKMTKNSKDAYPIYMHDQYCQIFHRSAAEVLFPCVYHGSAMSMHYAQFVIHKLFPSKQMALRRIKTRNTRHLPHEDEISDIIAHGLELVGKFNQDLFDKSFSNWSINFIQSMNARVEQELEISPEKCEFRESDLATIYNTDNPAWKSRRSKMTSGLSE